MSYYDIVALATCRSTCNLFSLWKQFFGVRTRFFRSTLAPNASKPRLAEDANYTCDEIAGAQGIDSACFNSSHCKDKGTLNRLKALDDSVTPAVALATS